MTDVASRACSNPDVLVSIDWVADNQDSPGIRIVESNEDQIPFPSGHIAGRAGRLADGPERPTPLRLPELRGLRRSCRAAAPPETTAIFYGDRENWHTVYVRVNCWARRGVLERVFAELQRDQSEALYDGTCVRGVLAIPLDNDNDNANVASLDEGRIDAPRWLNP